MAKILYVVIGKLARTTPSTWAVSPTYAVIASSTATHGFTLYWLQGGLSGLWLSNAWVKSPTSVADEIANIPEGSSYPPRRIGDSMGLMPFA